MMIHHDQPIQRPGQDLFNRSDFALTLARSISGLKAASDGFAFAITGRWGSGKSSVLHLITRYLAHIEMEQLSKVRLPWQKEPAPKTIDELEDMALSYEKVLPQIDHLAAENKYLSRASLDYQRQICRMAVDSDSAAEDALQYWHLKLKVQPRVIVLNFSLGWLPDVASLPLLS